MADRVTTKPRLETRQLTTYWQLQRNSYTNFPEPRRWQ
jgi:hypothetical protein